MRKIYLAVVLVATALVGNFAIAQETVPDSHIVSCFDYYNFGGVQLPITPTISTAAAGTKITFSGSIVNTNAYPVVDGRIVARIFKLPEVDIKNVNGPDVIDEFVVKDDLSLKASSTRPINIEWNVPHYLESGRYKIALFFVSAGKFNLLGLTFTDDIIGNSASFSVFNDTVTTESVRFVKDEVYISNKPYYFAAYPPRERAEGDVPVAARIKNTTNKAESVEVTWKVYSWDAQHDSNLVESATEIVAVPAKGSATTTYTVTHTGLPVYYLVAEFKYKDTKSIIAPRFVREGVGTTRINFPAVTSYPLVSGVPAELFSCMHATNDDATADGSGKLILSLKDKKGEVFHTYTYSGSITSEMMGVKDTFTPAKDYRDFTLVAELYKSGILTDKAEMHYGCKALGLGVQCRDTAKFIWTMILGLILLIILLIAHRRKPMTRKMITVIMILFGVSLLPTTTSAEKEVIWNTVLNHNLFIRDANSGVNKTELRKPNITVTYKTEVRKPTGEVLQGGETVPIGTVLTVKFVPHISDHIYWFGTGGVWDSPYGSWGNRNTLPPASCQEKDYTFTSRMNGGFSNLLDIKHFIPLVITPPVKTLSNVQGMTCTPVSAGGVSECTVTGGAQIGLSMNFANTEGSFYYRRETYKVSDGRLYGCSVPDPDVPMSVSPGQPPYVLQVPAKTVAYSFIAAPGANQPPSVPRISGPTQNTIGADNSFGFFSTDPEDDQIRYGIDWTDDGVNEVNSWIPSTGFVPDGVENFTNKIWPNEGTYTFKAMAQDEHGASSGWATHTITISPGGQCMTLGNGQINPLFQAHGRDYFYSSGDGRLYFAPLGAGAAAACNVDMCANTESQEPAVPAGQTWNLSASDPYTRYSCTPQNTCSCADRTYTCTQGGIVTSTVPNASQCAFNAACTYAQQPGRKIAFTYLGTNVLGTLVNGGTVIQDIPEGAGTLTDSRTLRDTFDNASATATCTYDYVAEEPADPKILTFTVTPIVEKGEQCVFTWTTQDMSSCTLGGTDYGMNGTHSFGTAEGSNITQRLSCTSDEDTPREFTQTKTCLVKPEVIEE